jgi:ribose-phosphate pyrophosphokinase
MENFIIFSLPDNMQLTEQLANALGIKIGVVEIRNFPDGETYIRINSDVKNKSIILVCSLDHPNNKILPLMFMAETIKALGATKICLISPYLPYMRQDKCFKPGEAVTAVLFGKCLSGFVDSLMTVDPHLHRIHQLSEVYSIPAVFTLHATTKIAAWIREHVNTPFIIGPDEESEQWVDEVAKETNAPYAIIKKIRYGDRNVSISIPNINNTDHTLVLVDDIISTGVSMLAAIQQFVSIGFKKIICIGVHGLFDNAVYEDLLHAGAAEVITCNTIPHFTNKIDITDVLLEGIKKW